MLIFAFALNIVSFIWNLIALSNNVSNDEGGLAISNAICMVANLFFAIWLGQDIF